MKKGAGLLDLLNLNYESQRDPAPHNDFYYITTSQQSNLFYCNFVNIIVEMKQKKFCESSKHNLVVFDIPILT